MNGGLLARVVTAVLVLSPAGFAQQLTPPAATPARPDPVLVGAGDIADCSKIGPARKTAELIEKIDGTVFTLGDNAYDSGTPAQFERCYDPTWGVSRTGRGRHSAITTIGRSARRPISPTSAPRRAIPRKGYYSYDLGTWHVIVVNSNCNEVGGCRRGSPQEQWLRQDLAAHPVRCTVAMWHHPRFSSAQHGDDFGMRDIWKDLVDAGADLVLSGHDHDYERFAPMNAAGEPDPEHGVREFVVGTGGRYLYNWGVIHATSQVRNNQTFGILKLTLHPEAYDWQFLPADGSDFTDSGSAKCH